MKKSLAVLLSVIMLLSTLCLPALASEPVEYDAVEAALPIHGGWINCEILKMDLSIQLSVKLYLIPFLSPPSPHPPPTNDNSFI